MSGSIVKHSLQNFSSSRQHTILEKFPGLHTCNCLISCIPERLFRKKLNRFPRKRYHCGTEGEEEWGGGQRKGDKAH